MSPEEKAALTTKLRGGRPEKSISLDPRTRVIAVASGKGGVGKSSLTVNLAVALDALGQSVGLIDADIYGHSIPHMLGIHQRPIVVDKMIVPPVRGRLKFISIGNFMDDNAPLMWRGPMLHRALEQFLSDVHWGELDTIVVDMPPGTGDIAISLGQLLPRAEVLVVTTPQPLAQEVASRAAVMAQKTGLRLLGVVENMTGEAFGSGGGARLAEQLGVSLLGTVPLDPALREAGDSGVPVVEARAGVRVGPRDLRDRGRGRGRAPGDDPQAADRALLDRRGRGRLLRPRPHAAAPLERARARGLVPRARRDRPRPAREGGRLAAPLRRARGERRDRAEGGRGRADGPEGLPRRRAARRSSPARWSRC